MANAGEESLTLYVNNLNDRIHTNVLAKNLREIFGAFGKIQDLVCMKSLRRRGQVWVVFADQSSATAALKALQGFPFYNKPIRIAFATARSDVVTKADGSFVERTKIKNTLDRRENQKNQQKDPAAPGFELPNSTARGRNLPINTVPSKTLFVENLPPEATPEQVQMLFQQMPMLVDVRAIPGRNVAFVDFADETFAGNALNALQGFAFNQSSRLVISYAR